MQYSLHTAEQKQSVFKAVNECLFSKAHGVGERLRNKFGKLHKCLDLMKCLLLICWLTCLNNILRINSSQVSGLLTRTSTSGCSLTSPLHIRTRLFLWRDVGSYCHWCNCLKGLLLRGQVRSLIVYKSIIGLTLSGWLFLSPSLSTMLTKVGACLLM